LPWFTNWQHFGKGEYVTGLEPGTNPPIGQAEARARNELLVIEPGKIKVFDLEIEVLTNKEVINHLLNSNGSDGEW